MKNNLSAEEKEISRLVKEIQSIRERENKEKEAKQLAIKKAKSKAASLASIAELSKPKPMDKIFQYGLPTLLIPFIVLLSFGLYAEAICTFLSINLLGAMNAGANRNKLVYMFLVGIILSFISLIVLILNPIS